MRALNSQRPRSTSNQRLVSRTILCYLLLLCVLRDVRARSVPHDDGGDGHGDGVRVDQAQGKISEPVEVSDFRPNDEAAKANMRQAEARRRSLTAYVERDANGEDAGEGRNESEKEVLVADPENVQAEAAGDEGSVAKKRRRNDVSLLGKSVLQEDGEVVARDVEENAQKDEGIRRFDVRVESDDVDGLDQRKASHDLAENVPDSRRDAIEHEKRLVDPTERPHASTGNADANPSNEGRGTTPEGERYKEIIDELWEELENATNSEQTEKIDLNKETVEGMKNLSAEVNPDEMLIDLVNDETRNDFRSLESNGASENERRQSERIAEETPKEKRIAVEDSDLNREHRYLAGKSKYKSSTVYLNAEEGNLPGRDQESIVDGQIKKLISIRDDALGSIANDGAKDSDELGEDGLLSGKSIGVDVVATDKNEEVRNQRSSGTEQIASRGNVNVDQFSVPNRIQRWRDQAAMIQEQIRNRTFLQYLKEQAIEVLPDIPKFTEGQLLETLKRIASSRGSPSNETYSASLMNASALSENQLEIIKCAEQLTATKQRQSFVSNMAECIRGLSFFNCLRVFVWPVVLDNLPESVRENLNSLPIEINLIDLFQGDRAKAMRAESGAHRPRLLTPEYVVFSILKGTLDSKATYDQAPVFIDLRNETFRRLLTIGQLQILQMAERLLPGEARREYSDRMFSCVRRFEYFSCVKYFAWPMVKQYHPALPEFPDYQAWYPSVALYPEYPIVPFPSFVENTGELPEVVEADATRMRRPEATIVSILQNTLREHAKAPPPPPPLPTVVHNVDSHVALLSPEQLLSIRMAEQLLPVSYRPGFVDRTIRCIRDFNYLTCIRYSAWPTVRQFYPALPDISGWIPDWQLPDVFGYLPELPNLPNLSDLSSFVPGLGSGGETSTTEQQPPQQSGSIQVSGRFPAILLRRNDISFKASNELENKITEILTNARNSLKAAPENPSLIVSGNVIILTTIDEKQVNILKLAESILPPPARAPLVTQVLSCLRTNNDFINCTRYVIWPTVALYVPNFPEFPSSSVHRQPPMEENRQTPLKEESASHQPAAAKEQHEWNRSQNPAANPNVRIISRTKFPQSNGPVISVTGTRFVPIFTEHPESVILNILKSIQLSSPNVSDDPLVTKTTDSQQVADLFNDQQENIVRITEDLLPDAARPSFVDRMIECTRKGNFLTCSQDVLWPTLSEYFPRLPSFPNFAGYPQTSDVKPTLPQNLTDTSPFSETDVKVGQHGDATVTITDTRFFPVFSEDPEAVILRILKAVQYATPGVPASITRTPEITTYFTEQQSNIVQIVESLLPESVRPVFVERMVTCVRENAFLQCTRDIAWPTVAQFFPRLPNFPNFGGYQNLPRMKLDLSSILLRNAYAEGRTPDESSSSSISKTTKEIIEEKMESVLKELVSKGSTSRSDNSHLDVRNPAISALLTAREVNIIRLTERAIPNPLRRAYATNMVECVKSNNFMSCTEHVSWPTLRQLIPNLPSFEQLFGQLPGVGQFPDLTGQLPSFPPELGNFPFPPTAPSLPQLPPQIAAIPGGIQSGISQLPGLPEFPTFGGINFAPVTLLADAPQEARPYDQVVQSSRASHAEQTRSQISGVSVAANTPSVDIQGTVPGYLGQPTNILIDISKEKIRLSDIEQQRGPLPESVSSNPSKKRERRRRSADEPSDYYYGTGGEVELTPPTADNMTFPNITESEFLQLLVNISRSNNASKRQPDERPKVHFVDTLNSTIRNSLTADQYEILKIVENLNEETANRGFLSRLTRCITSLSFIRCVGIFVWPIITSVPAAIGVPSLPSLPGLGIFGRSMESEVEHFFGMSTEDFEKELLTRKESVENILLDWHKKLMQDKFQTNVGFLNIRGYGNGEVGVSFNGFRKGRATKIKDNKNLPSILTIISDIMEEVLDQRPDNEKIKKDKEKRERSLDDMQEADFQFLKESDEYADIKRSINDDQIITMFLNKIKANATDLSADGDVSQFLNAEDAYNAFGVLFGTRLNDKFANRLKAFTEEHLRNANKDISADYAKQSNAEEFKVIPLKEEMSYDLERESTESQEERKREHRAKNEFKILLDKYSDKFMRNVPAERIDDPDNENKIKDAESIADKTTRSELRIRLPLLQEEIISRKITSTMIQLGRALKMKMGHVMPGIGFLISFLIQTALAHARAAASVAGIISNMALASAVFSMIRQNLFGSENPKIKYVYDNDKTGPGITWPHHDSHHHHSK